MTKRRWTDQEVADYRKKTGAFFYFNKEDSNVFVAKSSGFGRTLNFASPLAWLFVAVVVAVLAYSSKL